MTATPIYPQTIRTIAAKIQNSDSTNKVAIITGGTNGTKLTSLQIVSDDTVSKTLSLFITKSGVDYPLGVYSINAGQGNSSGNSATVLLGSTIAGPAPVATGFVAELDALGNKIMWLESGAILKASVSAAMTSGKSIYFLGAAGDF